MRIVTLALLLPLAACNASASDGAPAQQTTAVLTNLRPGTPLEEMLLHLDQALVRAIAGDLEGSAEEAFRRGEAITDRLLEARLPFEWITSDQYSVQARLRQIQSGADRVMAQLQTGAPRDSILKDLRALRADVLLLRQAIGRGGGRAPVPLQQLLRADSLARPAAPRPAETPATPTTPAATRPDTTTARDRPAPSRTVASR